MKKICFIVQRYGIEVNGGAELLCRQFAERLTEDYKVQVATSKAIDYVTWKDEYIREDDIINKVSVKRFSVEKPRHQDKFNEINARFLSDKEEFSEKDEEDWVKEQGPFLPKLIEYLKSMEKEYDVFIFFTYLYYPTVFGLSVVKDKSIFIPTAHDEPFLKMKIFKNIFQIPKAIFYNTIEEKNLVESKFNSGYIKNEIGGVGIDLPSVVNPDDFIRKYKLDNFIIYVGRIDEGKNCHIMFKYFQEYKRRNKNSIKLVLIGKNVIPVPEDENIISLGFVSDEDKFNGIAASKILLLPSRFESLSLVVLEAMKLKRPVIVNGECEVLKGHCQKSNGGFYYKNYFEFEAQVNYLLENKTIYQKICDNGEKYVEQYYQWNVIISKLKELIEYVAE